MENFQVKPIGYIKSDFSEKFGIPRQSGRAPSLKAKVIFHPEYRSDDALRGIEGFTHLWILFDFSKAHKDEFSPLVRPPRLGGNKKVGVFASRSPFRPNHIGLSSVKFEKLEKTEKYGTVIVISGADLLDGTPIYDVKPYLPFTDCHPDAKGGYAEELKDYKLKVNLCDEVFSLLSQEKIDALTECLADDPRPSYQDDGKEYGLTFAGVNLKFTVQNGTLTVISAQKI
ncbi:MAG: tRNA (N6-threonylcarbamoyladenosine(37)-N6)-methyltransferase TrmO [Clostridiales bacterium]|nr:tRNA (N6-threonylcarbamoyladenosine(37)-N6)-methyltransferase TrmO [Clostridiales bacterium]